MPDVCQNLPPNVIMQELNHLRFFRERTLTEFPGVEHAFFTRHGGFSQGTFASLNLSQAVGDDPVRVAENQRTICRSFNFPQEQLVLLRQVHGNKVLDVSEKPPPLSTREYDGLVTAIKEWALCILTADCLPILFYDPEKVVIAAAHVGWRGCLYNISGKILQMMQVSYGCRLPNIRVVLGPAIGPCCYQVKDDVRRHFDEKWRRIGFHQYLDLKGHYCLDIKAIERNKFWEAGLSPEHIADIPLCTSCRQDLFFSHRAAKGAAGRQANIILLKK